MPRILTSTLSHIHILPHLLSCIYILSHILKSTHCPTYWHPPFPRTHILPHLLIYPAYTYCLTYLHPHTTSYIILHTHTVWHTYIHIPPHILSCIRILSDILTSTYYLTYYPAYAYCLTYLHPHTTSHIILHTHTIWHTTYTYYIYILSDKLTSTYCPTYLHPHTAPHKRPASFPWPRPSGAHSQTHGMHPDLQTHPNTITLNSFSPITTFVTQPSKPSSAQLSHTQTPCTSNWNASLCWEIIFVWHFKSLEQSVENVLLTLVFSKVHEGWAGTAIKRRPPVPAQQETNQKWRPHKTTTMGMHLLQ